MSKHLTINNIGTGLSYDSGTGLFNATGATLQQVTDAGATTTNIISTAGLQLPTDAITEIKGGNSNTQSIKFTTYSELDLTAPSWITINAPYTRISATSEFQIQQGNGSAKFVDSGKLLLGGITDQGDYKLQVDGFIYSNTGMVIQKGGATLPILAGDETFVLATNTNSNLRIQSGNNYISYIILDSANNSNAGRIYYHNDVNKLAFWTAGSEKLSIGATGKITSSNSGFVYDPDANGGIGQFRLAFSGANPYTNSTNPLFVMDAPIGSAEVGMSFRHNNIEKGHFRVADNGQYIISASADIFLGYTGSPIWFGSYDSAQGYGMHYDNTKRGLGINTGLGALSYNLDVNGTGHFSDKLFLGGVTDQGNYKLQVGGNAFANGNMNVTGGYAIDGDIVFKYNGDSIALGPWAGMGSGWDNVALGNSALGAISTGGSNVGVGTSSFYASDGSNNTGVGTYSGRYLTGGENTAVGSSALTGAYNASTGVNYNTAIGFQAGTGIRTGGSYNTFIGWKAGSNISTGSRNILIGQNIQASSATVNDELNIGGAIKGDLSTKAITLPNLAGADTRMVVTDAAGKLSTQAIPSGSGTDTNFANTNLTATASRTHAFGDNALNMNAGEMTFSLSKTTLAGASNSVQMWNTKFSSAVSRQDTDFYSVISHNGNTASFGIERYTDQTVYSKLNIDSAGVTLNSGSGFGGVLNLYGATVNLGTSAGSTNINGTPKLVKLAGAGTRLVAVADDGTLSATAIPASKQYKSESVKSPTASENITLFYTDVPVSFEWIQTVCSGTNPTVTFSIGYAAARNSAPTNVLANHVVNNVDEEIQGTFNIPANSYVILTTSATSGTVNEFHVTIKY